MKSPEKKKNQLNRQKVNKNELFVFTCALYRNKQY